MSKKQTAVEWLVNELLDGKPLMPSLIEQAKQMEKGSIDDAWRKYRGFTNNEDAWSFKEWLKKYYYE